MQTADAHEHYDLLSDLFYIINQVINQFSFFFNSDL